MTTLKNVLLFLGCLVLKNSHWNCHHLSRNTVQSEVCFEEEDREGLLIT